MLCFLAYKQVKHTKFSISKVKRFILFTEYLKGASFNYLKIKSTKKKTEKEREREERITIIKNNITELNKEINCSKLIIKND